MTVWRTRRAFHYRDDGKWRWWGWSPSRGDLFEPLSRRRSRLIVFSLSSHVLSQLATSTMASSTTTLAMTATAKAGRKKIIYALGLRAGWASWQETNQPRTASDQNIHNVCCNFADTIQRVFWHRHYVKYRRKVKNDGNNHKARDSVKHVLADGFQHIPPPWCASKI